MNPLHILDIRTRKTIAKLQAVRDNRTKEQKEAEKEKAHLRINSNITPFLGKLDVLKSSQEQVYVYFTFREFIVSVDVQKCMKKLTGDDIPNYIAVGEEETSVIVKVDPNKLNLSSLKTNDRFLSYMGCLKAEPKILRSRNFADAFREVDSELIDDPNTNKVIIIIKRFTETQSHITSLTNLVSFQSLKPIRELGIIFGTLEKKTDVELIREQEFVSAAFLQDIETLTPETKELYQLTRNKTNHPIEILADKNELRTKPSACIIDCGVSEDVLVVEKSSAIQDFKKNDLDHGTQVASITSCANSLLKREKILKQEYRLYSYNMCDGEKENIIEGIVNAIKTFREHTNLFILSYNINYTLPSTLIQHLTKRIDYFLHKTNTILLVSTGNNADETVLDAIKHNYLDKNPILFPSNCKNSFSVGALAQFDSIKKEIAPYTRYLPFFPTLEYEAEEFYILKPNLYVFGGSEQFNKQTQYLYSVSADGKIVNSFGTSFANALAGFYFLRLIQVYSDIKYAETYKALMLATGEIDFLKNRLEGSCKITINSERELINDSKFILIKNEREEKLNEYKPRKPKGSPLHQNAEAISLYVDVEKFEKIQVFLIHSNNYPINPYVQSLIYFNIRVLAPDGKNVNKKYDLFGDRSKWSTFGKCTPIQIAEYQLGTTSPKKTAQTGMWEFIVMPRRKNIPLSAEVTVRWGMVIKLIPRQEYEGEIEEIFTELSEKMGIKKPAEPDFANQLGVAKHEV